MRDPKVGSGFSWKLIVVAILSIGVGFLAFNFHHILRVSHVHISLAHHHRSHAFCSFTGCNLIEDLTEPNLTPENAADVSDGASSPQGGRWTMVALSREAAKAEGPGPIPEDKIAAVTDSLASRVCGHPAIDGYSHVVPQCLEDSPTNKWWQNYYAQGGKQADLVMHVEKSAGYDGLAVGWGINNKVKSAEECGQQCLDHMPNYQGQGPYDKLPCNAFVWCPDDVCFEPDAHHHTKGDCWLKFTEGPASPELNQRGKLPDWYMKKHADAPPIVQWWSGVLLPAGIEPNNGTWGPRYQW
eukprot:gene12331-15505_t